jgi:hypothetical protein
MKKSIVATLAAGALVFAACGSDSGGASGAQGDAADAVIAAASEEGIELDEDCVDDLASGLSDEDAEAIAEAGPDGDPDVSEEGTAIGLELMSCADNDQIVDAFIEQMKGTGQEFDEDCVREGLEGVDLADVASEASSGVPTELVDAVFDCFELGS